MKTPAFKIFPLHEAVRCFSCASPDMDSHVPSEYPTGRWMKRCQACGKTTFYDLGHFDLVMEHWQQDVTDEIGAGRRCMLSRNFSQKKRVVLGHDTRPPCMFACDMLKQPDFVGWTRNGRGAMFLKDRMFGIRSLDIVSREPGQPSPDCL